jgi:hypothetical protein
VSSDGVFDEVSFCATSVFSVPLYSSLRALIHRRGTENTEIAQRDLFRNQVVALAPAERKVSGNGTLAGFRFAPLKRGVMLEVGSSINISSLWDEEIAKTILLRTQEIAGDSTQPIKLVIDQTGFYQPAYVRQKREVRK